MWAVLVYTFVVVLREKIRTLANFIKILANYTSKESLITAEYDKNTIEANFLLKKCQVPVRGETCEGSSIEFNGYRIPQHEQNGCSLIHKASINESISGFFDISCLDIDI